MLIKGGPVLVSLEGEIAETAGVVELVAVSFNRRLLWTLEMM